MSTHDVPLDAPPLAAAEEVVVRPSRAVGGARRRFWRNRGAVIALVFLGALLVLAVLQHFITPYAPNDQDIRNAYADPSWAHWLGTDDLGRDLLSRLIVGAAVSMRISLQVVAVAVAIALPVGLLSGYLGGRFDSITMRIVDAGLSFPPLVLALAIAGVLGAGLGNAALAISIVLVPGFVRLVRASALAVSQETFIEASRSIGTSTSRIVIQRVLPNVLSPLVVAVTLSFGGAIVAEAGLSFINLSVQSPDASWGNMLRRAYDNALFTHPWQLAVPGAAIALTVLAYNTVGDALRDALGGTDTPRRRRRRARGRRGITLVERTPVGVDRTAATDALLDVRGLSVEFDTADGPVQVLDRVSLDVRPGEVVGVVGESGSGKTVTALSIMRLLTSPPGRIVGGEVWFEGADLLSCSLEQMRRVRGARMAMVFQDPMTSLNPAFTVGNQLVEAIRLHEAVSRADARRRSADLLQLVGMPDPQERLDDYPHQLSGGMRQRVMLAIALACEPHMLIADEPTTALDVTTQAQILELLRSLQAELRLAIVFVTHDLGVVAEICDRVVVMYAGQVVERAPMEKLFAAPQHPYTAALLRAIPQSARTDEPLPVIPGQVPSPDALPHGCRFAPRCIHVRDVCSAAPVPLEQCATDREVRCVRRDELELGTT